MNDGATEATSDALWQWVDLLHILAQPWSSDWVTLMKVDLEVSGDVTRFAQTELDRLLSDPAASASPPWGGRSVEEVVRHAETFLGLRTARALEQAVTTIVTDPRTILTANAWIIGSQWLISGPPDEVKEFTEATLSQIKQILAAEDVVVRLEAAAKWRSQMVPARSTLDRELQDGASRAAEQSLVIQAWKSMTDHLRRDLPAAIYARLGRWILDRAREVGIDPDGV